MPAIENNFPDSHAREVDKLAVVPETGERLEEEPSEAGESGIRNEKRRLKDLKISIREKECGSENTKMGA